VWLAQELRHAYNIKSFSVDKRKNSANNIAESENQEFAQAQNSGLSYAKTSFCATFALRIFG